MNVKTSLGEKIKSYSIVVVPAVVFIFSLLGVTHKVVGFIGHNYVHQQAVLYLQQSEQASKSTFILLSTAKAAMGVIESSEGGISFIIDAQVQLGKAFEALKELIDYAWDISIVGLSVLFITQLLLHYTQSLLYILFTTLSVCWLLYALAEKFQSQFNQLFKRLFRSVAVASFMIAVALPLAVYGTSLISTTITADMKGAINAGFTQHNALYEDKNTDSSDLKSSTKSTLKKFKSTRKDVNEHVKNMHSYVYQHVAVLTLEVILLPLLLFWMLYHGIRLFVKGRAGDVTLY